MPRLGAGSLPATPNTISASDNISLLEEGGTEPLGPGSGANSQWTIPNSISACGKGGPEAEVPWPGAGSLHATPNTISACDNVSLSDKGGTLPLGPGSGANSQVTVPNSISACRKGGAEAEVPWPGAGNLQASPSTISACEIGGVCGLSASQVGPNRPDRISACGESGTHPGPEVEGEQASSGHMPVVPVQCMHDASPGHGSHVAGAVSQLSDEQLLGRLSDRHPNLLKALEQGKLSTEQVRRIIEQRAKAQERKRAKAKADGWTPNIAAAPGAATPHITQPPSEGNDEHASRHDPPDTAPRGGGKVFLARTIKRGHRRKGKPDLATLPPEHPLAPDVDSTVWHNDASIPAADTTHRQHGWWALDTVNANAWGGALKYTLNSAADVVLMQETKTRPGYNTEAAEQSARNAKWNVSIQACCETKAGGCSAGVAVGVRNYIGMSSTTAAEASKHLHPAGRFTLKRVSACGKGGLQCGSIYCYSGIGITAKPNLDLLESVAHTVKSLKGCWIIGGDWNCSPAQLAATGWPAKVGG